jgi:hypothetical protein
VTESAGDRQRCRILAHKCTLRTAHAEPLSSSRTGNGGGGSGIGAQSRRDGPLAWSPSPYLSARDARTVGGAVLLCHLERLHLAHADADGLLPAPRIRTLCSALGLPPPPAVARLCRPAAARLNFAAVFEALTAAAAAAAAEQGRPVSLGGAVAAYARSAALPLGPPPTTVRPRTASASGPRRVPHLTSVEQHRHIPGRRPVSAPPILPPQ